MAGAAGLTAGPVSTMLPRPVLEVLVQDLAAQVTRQYRIVDGEAAALVSQCLARDRALATAIESAGTADQVRRTRAYRDAAREAKRTVYYHLRRYRPAEPAAAEALRALEGTPAGTPMPTLGGRAREVAACHVSTRERLADLDGFLAQLAAHAGRPRTVVDVGCGVFPLVFPLDDQPGAGVEQLWTLDRDEAALRAVTAYARARADRRVRAVRWDVRDGWGALARHDPPERFDLALLLKVVPVIARQDPAALATLAAVPAELLVVSGSATAMTRRRDIRRREAGVIRRFLAAHDLRTVATFEAADELCYVAARAPNRRPSWP